MPVTQQDIEAQRSMVAQAGAKATQLSGTGSDFMSRVKEELRQRSIAKGTNQLAEAAKRARQEFVSAPAETREQYKDIDPFRRMALTSQQQGQRLGEITDITSLQKQQGSTIQDILDYAQQGIKAEAEREQANAALQQQSLDNMWREYQFAQQQALDYAQLNASQTSQTTGTWDAESNRVADELHTGLTDWTNAWNYLHAKYPDVPNEVIDARLGTQWREPGAYERYVASKTGTGARQQQRVSMATAGVIALNTAMSEMQSDPKNLWQAQLPGAIGARTYKRAIKAMGDAASRLQSGQVLNESEMRLYMELQPPNAILDNPRDIENAFNMYRRFFEAVLGTSGEEMGTFIKKDPYASFNDLTL